MSKRASKAPTEIESVDVAPFSMIGAPIIRPLAISLGFGMLIGSCVAAVMALGRRRTEESGEQTRAAFARPLDPANLSQTRDAGLDNIRDESRPIAWDRTDESSDESFPASDPPARF